MITRLSRGFRRAKDSALSASLRTAITHFFKEYGTMLSLEIDSHNKRVEFLIHPKGELEPIRVRIGRYEIVEKSDESLLIIHDITASREWLTILGQKTLLGKPLPLPAEYAALVKAVL